MGVSFSFYILKEKHIMNYKGLPVYNISIDFDTDEGLQLVSLVDDPAVVESFLTFNSEEPVKLVFTSDEEQHIISGVSLLADTPIYRCDEIGGYYVVFTKETIKQLVEKYNKENKTNLTSLQHNGQIISDCVMVESYFIDKERGICPKEFSHCPDGSWITSYKVTNDELWNEIKTSGQLNGFSVEISCQLEPAKEGQKIYDEPLSDEDKFFENLMQWLQGEDFEKKKKSEFEADRNDILRAIDKGNPILIDEGKDKAVEYWVHSIGKKSGNDLVVLFNPETKKWKTEYLKDIDEYIISKEKIGSFDYSDPTYEEIMDDEDVVVTRTKGSTSYSDLIHNKVMTMISYNDEKEKRALGLRQGAVIGNGYTKAGNECIRVMEVFGDSRSAREGDGVIPDYRLLLTKRIKSLKPMIGTAPWGWDVLDSRVNLEGDKSMFPCIDHITKEDLDK